MTVARPDVDLVRELLHYDPATGSLTWREREPRHFPGTEEQKRRYCSLWNGSFAGRPALNCPDFGYRSGSLLGRKALAHRVAWAVHYGKWPKNQIDHINGVRDDNRICNLRDATLVENRRNARMDKRNTSGVTGVCYDKTYERWRATISRRGRRVYLGTFEFFEDAIAARKEAERQADYADLHGSEARPYYPHRRDSYSKKSAT